MDSSLFQEHSIKFSRFFTTGSTGWHPVQPVQPVHRVSWCKTLILVILGPKSYMAQAHKLQIGFGQCCGPILGFGLGSLQPTTNPYGFLVVKQVENWREWAGLASAREIMGCVFSMLMEGISVLKGKEPKRLKCWEGYEYKRKKKKKKGKRGEGIFCWWEKQKVRAPSELRAWGKASTLRLFWRGVLQHLIFWRSSSAYTDHIWWRFWGK